MKTKQTIKLNTRVYHKDALRDSFKPGAVQWAGSAMMYGTVIKVIKSAIDGRMVRVLWDSGSSAVHTASSLRVFHD